MRNLICILFYFSAVTFQSFAQINTSNKKEHYKLIVREKVYIPDFKMKKYMAKVNEKDVRKLNEPLRALAAFYSALSSSSCKSVSDGQECDLTLALGLGKQGSTEHKDILRKWISPNFVLDVTLKQDCLLRPESSSHFNSYSFLEFIATQDTVKIYYRVVYFDAGNGSSHIYHDVAVIKNNKIDFIKLLGRAPKK
jgi:hypothetical protein